MFSYIYQVSERRLPKKEFITADTLSGNTLIDFDTKDLYYIRNLDYASTIKAFKHFDLSFKNVFKRNADNIAFLGGSDLLEETMAKIQKELGDWSEGLQKKEADSIKIPQQLHQLSYESSRGIKDLFYLNPDGNNYTMMHAIDFINYVINRNKTNYYIANVIGFYKKDPI